MRVFVASFIVSCYDYHTLYLYYASIALAVKSSSYKYLWSRTIHLQFVIYLYSAWKPRRFTVYCVLQFGFLAQFLFKYVIFNDPASFL